MESTVKPPVDNCWKQIGVWSRVSERCPRLKEVIHCRNCEVFTAAAQGLYDRDLPEDHLATWTPLYASQALQPDQSSVSVLVFRLGGEWLALPTATVQEIAEQRPVHRLPHRNGALLGLVNLNGRLEPCVSLHTLLGITRQGTAATGRQKVYPRLLLIGAEGRSFGFPADEVLGAHRYAPGELGDIPATLTHALARYSRGLLSVQEHTVGCIDERLLFSALDRVLA